MLLGKPVIVMPAILYADSPEFQEDFPTFTGIVIWKDAKLISKYTHGITHWSVRKLSKTIRYSVGDTNEAGAYLFLSNKEEFFAWIEENSPEDLEWLIWNLDAVDFV